MAADWNLLQWHQSRAGHERQRLDRHPEPHHLRRRLQRRGTLPIAVVAYVAESWQTYDARLEQEGWSTTTFTNASAWIPVPQVRYWFITQCTHSSKVPNFSPVLSVQAMPQIQVH